MKHRTSTAVIVEFKQNLGLMQSRYIMENLTSVAILIIVSSVRKDVGGKKGNRWQNLKKLICLIV